jgi:serine/threonine-protein kinase
MGEVYAAEHVRLGKQAAVKFLRDELTSDRSCVERFGREVRALAGLRDAHVVEVLDCGEVSNGTPYFVMERLFGQDLGRVIAGAPLDVARTLRLGLDTCAGLAAVHAAGLVHRDIKPANLFLVEGRRRELTKILDFGVAKVATGSTRGGAILGTIRYMAPEQLMDSAAVGPACDLYGLGAVLYHCLAGRPPHVADTEPRLMFAILNQQPEPLRKLRPDLPPALTALIDRALTSFPGDRPSSADEFYDALEACLPRCFEHAADGPSTTLHSTSQDAESNASPQRRGARRPNASLVLSLTGAGAVALGIGWALSRSSAATAAQPSSVDAVQPARPRPDEKLRAASAAAPTVAVPPPPAAGAPVAAASAETPATLAHGDGARARRVARVLPVASATGTLELGAEPYWASVRLDGREVGTTPLVLPAVPIGRHSLEASLHGGGTPQVSTLNLQADETQRLVFHFAAEDPGAPP